MSGDHMGFSRTERGGAAVATETRGRQRAARGGAGGVSENVPNVTKLSMGPCHDESMPQQPMDRIMVWPWRRFGKKVNETQ